MQMMRPKPSGARLASREPKKGERLPFQYKPGNPADDQSPAEG